MLKSARFKNFQAHKDSFIEFSDKVTAIFGTSDHGKSSIIRALQLFFTQKPRGSSYIRRKQKEPCELIIDTDNGSGTFIRDKSSGKYIVDNDEKTALQGNVPEEILGLLDIQDINITGQFEPFFLLFDTPGKAATKINNVTHLEKADELIKNLRDDLLKTNSKVKVYTEDVKNWQQELSKYVHLETYGIWLSKALSYNNRLVVLKEKESRLGGHTEALKGTVDVLDSIALVDISKLDEKINNLWDKKNDLVDKIGKLDRRLDEIDGCYGKLDEIEKIGKIGDIDKIDKYVNQYTKVSNDIKNLEKYNLFIKRTTDSIDVLEKSLLIVEQEVKDLTSQLTVCETCGQELTEEAKEYVLKDKK